MNSFIDFIAQIIPDKIYLSIKYKYHTGKKLDLKKPKTFSEKIQWLKINYRNDICPVYVDKLIVRSHIEKILGKEYLIPILGIYESVDQIDWNKLPDKFVLKCTHGSGCNLICLDKSKFNIEEAKQKLKVWMKRNWYWYGREWPYKDLKPRIICEKYMVDNITEFGLTDYKFYCFNGVPKYCQVIRGRNIDETVDFYDIDWNHMEFTGLKKTSKQSNGIPKPESYEQMLHISRQLSKGFPFVRVDLYYIQKKIYFGELTYFPLSGFGEFNPPEWNRKIGDLIDLPVVK